MRIFGLGSITGNTDLASASWTALSALTSIEVDYTATSGSTDLYSTLLTAIASKTLNSVTIKWRPSGGASGA
jgi:hypothetical protein